LSRGISPLRAFDKERNSNEVLPMAVINKQGNVIARVALGATAGRARSSIRFKVATSVISRRFSPAIIADHTTRMFVCDFNFSDARAAEEERSE
jgi:hypothetical protein